jgi:hypothetical protein
LFNVAWNNDTRSWEQIFQEYSSKDHVRIVQMNNNYSNYFSELDLSLINEKKDQSDYLHCCYVSFPIDLKLMNYPKTYVMSFHLMDAISVETIVGEGKLEGLDGSSKIIQRKAA